jgi:ribonuclease HI
MVYTLRFDGCCKPNPGEIGIGAIVLNQDKKMIIEISEKGGFGTNNQAEYTAIIRGLEELLKTYSGELLVQGDSQLVINQLKGEWNVKKRNLIPLYERVKELEVRFSKIEYEWIERNENKEADKLSAQALGLNLSKRDEKRVHLQTGSSYDIVFDDDDKILKVRDEKYNRDVQKYYIVSVIKDGKKIPGNFFETGSKKLIELLTYHTPLKNKKFRIIPTKSQNWTDYMVEEIAD